jgi:predicted glycoside hydrolase/deacetylase ChbG (UPF0249 family)
MGVGTALADAGERVRRLPALGVGLHLTLVGERPACPPEEVRSLVGPDGRLLPGYRPFLARYLRGGIRPDDLSREFRAQAAAIIGLDVTLDHLDSHQHLHLLPGVLSHALEIARQHGIRWIRAPRPLASTTGRQSDHAIQGVSPSPPLRPFSSAPRPVAERIMFRAASAWARRTLARADLPLTDGSLGFDCSGRLSSGYLLRKIAVLPPGITELICHPGAGDPDTRSRYESWGYRWRQELEALTDPAVQEALERAGVRLTSFTGVGR